MDDSSHSYAWTSVVIPGPQHTVQHKYNNKATFTLNQLEVQVDYQVQVQAKNAFGWGKVSEQFTFRTNAAGKRRAEGRGESCNLDEITRNTEYLYFSETMPVESVRKEYSIFMNNSVMRRSSILVLINCLILTRFLSKW